MEFPHLKDTNFPNLENVDVYSYHNVFDYSRWIVGTNIKLVNVLWNSDYNDVVKFETNDARDSYFNSLQDSYEIELTTNSQAVPDGRVKLPIPFDILSRYNYMIVTIPKMPGLPPYIENEGSNLGIRRWHFFIDSIEYKAPNTTLCNLTLDVWTQYINDIDIKYMYLERGHAGVAATDVDTYLANPIENNEYLLTPDATPSGAEIIRSCNYIPFGNGKKYVILACSLKPDQFALLGTISQSSDYQYSVPTFSDITNQRDGYQLQVNNFGIGNGYDYSGLKTPVDPTAANGARIPNGLNTYAIEASDVFGEPEVASFFQDIVKTCPTFMRTIHGCFIVDESMFSLMKEEYYLLAGHKVWWVHGKDEITNIPQLTRADFGFPSKYADYAKLYTFPYSKMEITDNEGKTITVKIESLSNSVHCHKVAQLTYPFTNFRIFFSGINGKGSNTYIWKNLVDDDINASIPKSDWFDYCFDHDIPCFALYMDGELDWYLDRFNSAARGNRAGLLAEYHSAARIANTNRENTLDIDLTTYTNTCASSDTVKANADRSATTVKQNADAAATTTKENDEETRDANDEIVYNNLRLGGDLTTTKCQAARDITDENIAASRSQVALANGYMQWSATAEEKVTAMTSASNMSNSSTQIGATSLSGAVSGAVTGVAMSNPFTGTALAITSLAAGVIQGVVNAQTLNTNAQILINASQTAVSLAQQNNDANQDISENLADAVQNIENQLASDLYDLQSDAVNDNQVTTHNAQTENINRIYALYCGGSGNVGNNARTETTTKANAAATNTTEKANALLLQSTSDSNATYTRNALIENSQELLRAEVQTAQASLLDARMRSSIKICDYNGDPLPDYNRTRGIQMKVKTMSDSEIAEVGDLFVRFGYAMNRVWTVTDFCPMNHFCYWKTGEIWIDDRVASNNDVAVQLQNIFSRGVTVWKNPEEIGRINVYTNW